MCLKWSGLRRDLLCHWQGSLSFPDTDGPNPEPQIKIFQISERKDQTWTLSSKPTTVALIPDQLQFVHNQALFSLDCATKKKKKKKRRKSVWICHCYAWSQAWNLTLILPQSQTLNGTPDWYRFEANCLILLESMSHKNVFLNNIFMCVRVMYKIISICKYLQKSHM